MLKYGLIFLLSAFTKLWLSIYMTDYYLMRQLEVFGSREGTVISNINNLVLIIIIIEILISVTLFFAWFKDKNKVIL